MPRCSVCCCRAACSLAATYRRDAHAALWRRCYGSARTSRTAQWPSRREGCMPKVLPAHPLCRAARVALAVAFGITASALLPLRGQAQSVSFGLGTGVAVPVGPLADRRGAGPDVRLSVALNERSPLALRGEFEGAWLSGSAGYRGIRLLSAQLVGTASLPGRARPYVLLGAGVSAVSGAVESSRSSRTVPLVSAGAGIATRVGSLDVAIEGRVQGVLSAYATGREYGTATFVPLVVRIGF